MYFLYKNFILLQFQEANYGPQFEAGSLLPCLCRRGQGHAAARSAGYSAAGAANQATRLLQNPQVAKRIGEFQALQAAA